MLFNIHNPYEAKRYKEYCNQLYQECLEAPYGVVEVKRKRLQRSKSQNAYLHLILGYYASEFGYTLNEVKQNLFKDKLNRDIFKAKRTNRRGQQVEYTRSSADLDTKEMTVAIDRFRNWSAAVAGFYIPAPNENEALLAAQQQIEAYEEYL